MLTTVRTCCGGPPSQVHRIGPSFVEKRISGLSAAGAVFAGTRVAPFPCRCAASLPVPKGAVTTDKYNAVCGLAPLILQPLRDTSCSFAIAIASVIVIACALLRDRPAPSPVSSSTLSVEAQRLRGMSGWDGRTASSKHIVIGHT